MTSLQPVTVTKKSPNGAASSIGIMVVPAFCGLLGQVFGMGVFPFYLLSLFAVMVLGIASIQRIMKAAGKDIR